MNVVDSSGWLEYFADGPNAAVFGDPILESDDLIVPSICIYEVYKQMHRQQGADMANGVVAAMRTGHVVDLDKDLAISAARLSLEERLPMADSIILATARVFGATVWTQDGDFEGKAGVRYVRKKSIIQERRSGQVAEPVQPPRKVLGRRTRARPRPVLAET